jgi:hypothetical protein
MLEPKKLAANGFLSLRANINAALNVSVSNVVTPAQAPVRQPAGQTQAAAFAW